jgi:hypothetical protein
MQKKILAVDDDLFILDALTELRGRIYPAGRRSVQKNRRVCTRFNTIGCYAGRFGRPRDM